MRRALGGLSSFTPGILSGILLGLPFASPAFTIMAWVCFVPLLVSANRQSALTSTINALLCGVTGYAIATHWLHTFLYAQLSSSSLLSNLACILYWGFMGCSFALLFMTSLLLNRFIRNIILGTFLQGLLFPIFIHLHFIYTPTLFPATLALTQSEFELLLGPVRYLGEGGLNFIILVFNSLIANQIIYLLMKLKQPNWRALFATTTPNYLLFGIWLTLSILVFEPPKLTNQNNNTEKSVLHISWVQPNYPAQLAIQQPEGLTRYYPLERYLEDALNRKADVIIWPETANRGILSSPRLLQHYQQIASETETTYLIQDIRESKGEFFNSVGIFSKDNPIMFYDKMNLIPYAEYFPNSSVPFIQKNIQKDLLQEFSENLSPGTHPTTTQIGQFHTAILICYDILFPEAFSASKKTGQIDFFTVVSNNVWFDSPSQIQLVKAATQLRALEQSRPIIHITNNGPSWIIDANGYTLYETPPNQRGAYSIDLPLPKAH